MPKFTLNTCVKIYLGHPWPDQLIYTFHSRVAERDYNDRKCHPQKLTVKKHGPTSVISSVSRGHLTFNKRFRQGIIPHTNVMTPSTPVVLQLTPQANHSWQYLGSPRYRHRCRFGHHDNLHLAYGFAIAFFLKLNGGNTHTCSDLERIGPTVCAVL